LCTLETLYRHCLEGREFLLGNVEDQDIQIIHSWNIEACVMRAEEGRFRLVGTAAGAENNHLVGARKKGNLVEGDGSIFEAVDLDSINSNHRLDLFVDIATAYRMKG